MGRYLIVGLGNPGLQYAANRHNIGFRCLDLLASVHGLMFSKNLRDASLALGTIEEQPVVLAKPQTFMNESGKAVEGLLHFYRIPLERLLVVYDDLDLPLGALRLRPEGGAGGHKGVESVIAHLGGQRGFPRLRIGIGRPPGHMDAAAYVLQDFSPEELPVVEEVLTRAVQAIKMWLRQGIEAAMNSFNHRRIPSAPKPT